MNPPDNTSSRFYATAEDAEESPKDGKVGLFTIFWLEEGEWTILLAVVINDLQQVYVCPTFYTFLLFTLRM